MVMKNLVTTSIVCCHCLVSVNGTRNFTHSCSCTVDVNVNIADKANNGLVLL